MDVNRHPGDATKGPEDRFSGDVWLWPRIGATRNAEVRNVLFTPGSRSAWHRHPAGQVLHVTEGVGVVQSRGGEREEIRAGDTVICHPGEEHWHGAAPGTFMTHIAVTDGPTEWHEHVTDDQYAFGEALIQPGSVHLPPGENAREAVGHEQGDGGRGADGLD